MTFSSDTAAVISAASTMVYAIISALSLFLLSQQIRDARRFGAAPALYALLKELEEHLKAMRRMTAADADETIKTLLEFFERIEHMRDAGVLPSRVLRQAFGDVLVTYLADPRVAAIIRRDPRQHKEVLALAERIGPAGWRFGADTAPAPAP